MNIRYPIYEGVYRILTIQVERKYQPGGKNGKNTPHLLSTFPRTKEG